MGDLFSSMPLMLDAQKAEEEGAEEKARWTAVLNLTQTKNLVRLFFKNRFDFTDTGEKITLKVK